MAVVYAALDTGFRVVAMVVTSAAVRVATRRVRPATVRCRTSRDQDHDGHQRSGQVLHGELSFLDPVPQSGSRFGAGIEQPFGGDPDCLAPEPHWDGQLRRSLTHEPPVLSTDGRTTDSQTSALPDQRPTQRPREPPISVSSC